MRIERARSQKAKEEACKFAESESLEFGEICKVSEEVWVVREGGRIVAAAGAECEHDHPVGCNLTFCVVSPDFRGQSLQKRLIQTRVKWAEREGCGWVATYAHNRNKHSLKNLIDLDFVVYSFGDPFVSFRKQL